MPAKHAAACKGLSGLLPEDELKWGPREGPTVTLFLWVWHCGAVRGDWHAGCRDSAVLSTAGLVWTGSCAGLEGGAQGLMLWSVKGRVSTECSA